MANELSTVVGYQAKCTVRGMPRGHLSELLSGRIRFAAAEAVMEETVS